MREGRQASFLRYAVRIKDTSTDSKCEVYVSSDLDLECLLLFLRMFTGLEYDVRGLRRETLDF